jgi:hypothetical protein
MLRHLTLGLLLSASVGCAKTRTPADDDIDGLMRYMFQNWEESERIDAAMTNLARWMASTGKEDEAMNDGFVLDALTAEQIGPLEYETERVPLERLVGAVATGDSVWSIDHHAELLPMEDQTWNAPGNYRTYDRTVIEGSPDLFLAPTAAQERFLIRTTNDVVQSRLGVSIPYVLRKDYRWVTTHDGARAVVGRTWAPTYGCSSNDGEGGNCLELSFSVDLFLEQDDGTTQRLTASWSRLSLIIELPLNIQIQTLVNGMRNVFRDTDSFLEELHGPQDD